VKLLGSSSPWRRLSSAVSARIKLRLRLRIAARLALAFGLVLSMFAATTIFSLVQMRSVERDMEAALLASNEVASEAGQMRRSIDGVLMNGMLMALAKSKEDVDFLRKDFDQAQAGYALTKKHLLERATGDAVPGLSSALEKLTESEAVAQSIDAVIRRRVADAAAVRAEDELAIDSAMVENLSGNVKSRFDFWAQAVDSVIEVTAAASRDRRERSRVAALLARSVQLTAAVLALLLGAGAAWWISRSVTQPIRQAVAVAERVARGELATGIPAGRSDETGALLEALGCMQSGLHELVSGVRDTVQSIETASAELAAGNADLARRTEMAASQLERTSSSVHSLSEAVNQTVGSARSVDGLARDAAEAARRGGDVVHGVVQSMDTITSQSKRIGEIVGTIEGIAFQTNILALNAAVEAARAGEQGRGFAVVAGEVRSLAQHSANAAKDIKGLIEASVENIQSGSRLAKDAGHTMVGAVTSAQQVTTAIAGIVTSAADQSSCIGEVGRAMSDIDRLTQQNSALVEQSSAAAESLKSQAQRLAMLVSAFQLEGAQADAH
jgi:methyl-accepting chemotaxis protein